MAVPEQKMSGSDKNLSRFGALVNGYMMGQMAGGASTPATTPPVPAAGAGFSPLTVGSNAAGLQGSNLLQAANAGVTSANIPAITPWNFWDKFKYATGNTTLNIPYGY
jgi:hypothetical protein